MSEIETSETAIAKLYQEKSMKEQKQQDIAKAIEGFQRRMEKSIARKAALTNEAAECARAIRDLGVLPEEAFEKYERLDSKAVSLIDRCRYHNSQF